MGKWKMIGGQRDLREIPFSFSIFHFQLGAAFDRKPPELLDYGGVGRTIALDKGTAARLDDRLERSALGDQFAFEALFAAPGNGLRHGVPLPA